MQSLASRNLELLQKTREHFCIMQEAGYTCIRHCLCSLKIRQFTTKISKQNYHKDKHIEVWARNVKVTFKKYAINGLKINKENLFSVRRKGAFPSLPEFESKTALTWLKNALAMQATKRVTFLSLYKNIVFPKGKQTQNI